MKNLFLLQERNLINLNKIQGFDETDIRTLKTKGILLYPTTSKNFDQSYKIENHTISVKTVNLADKWYNIDKRLRQIINE